MGGFEFNAGEFVDQNVPSEEEADTVGMQQNKVITDLVFEANASCLTPRKEIGEGGDVWRNFWAINFFLRR